MNGNLPSGNAGYINRLNKIKVLSLIKERDEISRANIVKETGLSAPTVTRIVDSLIKVEKLAIQVGIGESSGGRPPKIVKFNGEDNFVIGIDWGRTHIYGILSDLNGSSLIEMDIETDSEDDFTLDLEEVIKLITDLITQSKIDISKLRGIGVAAAGFVNNKTNTIEYSPNFNWKNVNIKQPLENHFNVPIIVDNVSRVMALGELHYGIGEKLKDYIFVNVGYGIGAGIIVNGQPFYGVDGFSGEIGHNRAVSAPMGGIVCTCGKIDCLEAYSSGRGLKDLAERQLEIYPNSSLASKTKISAQIIAEEATKGDLFATTLITQAGEHLAVAIASMSNFINPRAIILGGKIVKSGDLFTNKIKEVFNREILQQTQRKIKIEKSSLEDEAAVKGAVSLILQEILKLNI